MTRPKGSPWGRALDAMASLKLSIFLFFSLAATSVFGTVIQQQADPEAYVESYGPTLARLIGSLGLTDMYHSWWFELLLALLLVNTLLCSLRRLPAALRQIRGEQFGGEEAWNTKPLRAEWAAGPDAEAVARVLGRRMGRPRVRRGDGGVRFFAQRQRWARLGAYVAHASLVLFFLGGIVGARFGFKGFVNIVEGESVSAVQLRGGGTLELPFEVECEAFELHQYPDGRPKDYLSRLVVRRGDEVLQRKTIEVNDPLIQDGVFFYQSSYGTVGGGAVLRILDPEGNPVAGPVRLAEQESFPIPGTDLAVEVTATAENLQGFGPAAQLALVRIADGGHHHVGEPFVVLQNFPDFDRRRGGPFVFRMEGLLPGKWYTGLQVAKDPGVPLIWAGSALLTLGTLMALFTSHRRVWVWVEAGRVRVAGAASRNREGFQREFEALVAELRALSREASNEKRAVG
ncbi:cytochrome c biogenesis protein ResB [Deferrisoma sp.]